MAKVTPPLRSLRQAAVELDADPKVIRTLVRIYKIPRYKVGRAGAIDVAGFELLSRAYRTLQAHPVETRA